MATAPYTLQDNARFSGRWWWEQARTLLWVALVTILIWIYADMEFTQTRELTVNVRLVVNPKGDIAVVGQRDFAVSVRAQGNRSSLDAFENFLKANGNRLEIDVSTCKPPGDDLAAQDLLKRSPELAKAGLTLTVSDDERVKFQIDRLVTRDVPVEFVCSGGTVSGKPVITPSTVKVRLPSSQWAQLDKAAAPLALPTETENLDHQQRNKPIQIRVGLVGTLGGAAVQPNPGAVTVDLQVEQAVGSIQLKVPVQVVVPPGWVSGDAFWREYKLEQENPPDWRPALNIVGSAKDLEALKARQDEIKAFIELTENEKLPTSSWIPGKVTVVLPRDLDVRLQGAPPVLKFRLTKIGG